MHFEKPMDTYNLENHGSFRDFNTEYTSSSNGITPQKSKKVRLLYLESPKIEDVSSRN